MALSGNTLVQPLSKSQKITIVGENSYGWRKCKHSHYEKQYGERFLKIKKKN
jgi:hypothetical protein